jgi:hypothetical protein
MKKSMALLTAICMMALSTTLLAKRSVDDGSYLAYDSPEESATITNSYYDHQPQVEPKYQPQPAAVAEYQLHPAAKYQPKSIVAQKEQLDFDTHKMVIDAKLRAEQIRMEARWEAKKSRLMAELEIERSRMEVELVKKRIRLLSELERQQLTATAYQQPAPQVERVYKKRESVFNKREIASERVIAPVNYQPAVPATPYGGYQWKSTTQSAPKDKTPYGFDFHPGGY